jgi:hypothetical protein
LGTRLVERELARRELRIEQLVHHMEAINRDLDALAEELSLYRLALCLIELKHRSERDDLVEWLRFALESDNDEPLLDSAIECLVKPRLATIDAQPADTGKYVYRLHPDWPAIIAQLSATAMAPELLEWLNEQM